MMQMRRMKPGFFILGFLWVVFVFPFMTAGQRAAAKTEKLGTSYQIRQKGTKYTSSDSSIAYVDQDGFVTAKKIGETFIRIQSDGEVSKQRIKVVANGKKTRRIKVSTGEVSVTGNHVTYRSVVTKGGGISTPIPVPPVILEPSENPETTQVPEDWKESHIEPVSTVMPAETPEIVAVTNTPVPQATSVPKPTASPAKQKITFTAEITLKNDGEYLTPKVILYGSVGDTLYKIKCGALGAGQTKKVKLVKTVSASALNMKKDQMELKKIRVYSNKMYTLYQYRSKKTTFHYGTKDTEPPVISGFVEENSYNQKMPFMVVYSDDEEYDFFKYVKAEDDRDETVDLTVNTDKVNFKKAGKYKITYIAEDQAGNTAKVKAKIEVRVKKTVDEYADEILLGLIKEKWSDLKKAKHIYDYVRNHISYVGYSNKNSWESEAIHGMRYGRGDCYTYYSLARALLTRAGIPNIEVTRYRGAGHHWWNMVYVNGGWYHYDCGPRIGGGRFCLLTDAQLTEYSKTHGNKYIWNYDALPKTSTKTLTSVF